MNNPREIKKLLTWCQNCREKQGIKRKEDNSFLCDPCFAGIDWDKYLLGRKTREGLNISH